MNSSGHSFNSLVENIYSLTLDEKEEIKNLLEHNIAESRRNEISENAQQSKKEEESGELRFSSIIDDLKKML